MDSGRNQCLAKKRTNRKTSLKSNGYWKYYLAPGCRTLVTCVKILFGSISFGVKG